MLSQSWSQLPAPVLGTPSLRPDLLGINLFVNSLRHDSIEERDGHGYDIVATPALNGRERELFIILIFHVAKRKLFNLVLTYYLVISPFPQHNGRYQVSHDPRLGRPPARQAPELGF